MPIHFDFDYDDEAVHAVELPIWYSGLLIQA